jgi:hypothetical protein
MDENKWNGFVAVPETGELSCEGCHFATPHPEHPTRTKCLRTDDAPRCTAELRKDERNIIWVKEGVIDG